MYRAMKLKELRQLKGVTQGEIADKLNITVQVVSRYENNLREPDIQTLCALADYFQVSIDELVGHNQITDEHRSFEDQILIDVACLSDRNKDRLRSTLFNNDELSLIEEYACLPKDDQLRLRKIMRALKNVAAAEQISETDCV